MASRSQTRVKSLATNCDFGQHLDHSLKDKFICGLIKGPILDKMFEMKIEDTLAQCYDAALRRELTVKHIKNASLSVCSMASYKENFSDLPL